MATNGALKRGNENTAGEIDAKKFKGQDSDTFTTLPYRDVPYEDQLKKKQGEIEQTFAAFGNQFKKKYPQYAQWYTKVFLETRFKIDNIQKSPKTLAYRNKCELTIGYNPDEGKLCAGPRIANSEDGKVQVGPCDKETLIHLPPSMVDIAQDFSNFLDKWNYLEEKCPWLNLFIRVTKGGDHMLMVMVLDGGLDVIKERKNELVKYYTDDYTLTHNVKSIFIQPRKENSGKKSFELDFLHAHGQEFLVEKLIDIQLVVTPSIFFRINTYAAEVLYQKTLNCADLKKRLTLVIDLWCGCGELSLLAAKRAQHVIAIDPSKWNIRKAQYMAKYNKIFNIDFIIAQPEDGLKQVWHQLPMAAEIVIIADPPTLCKMMALGDMVAEMTNLKRFIYLYSSHKLHLVKNMLSLTEASLLPTRVIPVDVAPHNVRLELIASMTKVDPNEAPPPMALEEALPTADYIEQIERRAFAMGMAKALESGAPVAPLVPARPAIPSIMDEDYGFARRPLPEPEFGFGARRGGFSGPARPAGRFGAYEPEYPAAGFQASRGAGRYDDFDDEPPARFAGDAGRGGRNLKSVANNVAHNTFGGTPEKYGGSSGLGFRAGRGGFGASETSKKFGFGGGSSEYEDFSEYIGGYGDGAFGGARDRGFGAASRGGGGFGKDGFGRSGFSVETSFADSDPSSFSSGFGGAKGSFGGRGSRGGFGDRGSRGGFGDRGSRGGFGDRGSRGGFGDRGSRGGFGGRGGLRGRGGR